MRRPKKAKLETPEVELIAGRSEAKSARFSGWFDRQGQPLGEDYERIEKLLQDRDYKVVKQTHVGHYWVSTVWLGLNHSFGHEELPPLIFESMVFDTDKKEKYKLGEKEFETMGEEMTQVRYATEAEAKDGHKKLVKEYRKKL